ncbi:MAG: cell division protein FtsL [Gammaproteobacteria bacterium]|jgi:cell division protein FtsL|nr:cell division protein FtsL [Gammaproteobacteria bacterium]
MNQRRRILFIVTLLFSMLLGSAILLVYSKHQSRKLFVELQQLKYQVDILNTEWSQLQLEQSAWSGHGRIERIARNRLSMVMPEPGDVVFVEQ